MRILSRSSLLALLLVPAAPLLGLSDAWCDAGDDALAAFGFKNYPRALALAQPAAQDGDILAQLVLGRMYGEGKGVPKNGVESDKLFRQALARARPAAKKGDSRAEYVFGRLLENGWGLEKNPAKAVAWYRDSARQGYAAAQFNLGFIYSHGDGVARDSGQALAWYRQAAEQGYAAAQFNLGSMYHQGSGVARNPEQALAWYRKAAAQGAAPAQYMLGFYYEKALGGLAKDDRQAANWYRKAAAQGYLPESRDRKPGDLWEAAAGAQASETQVSTAAAVPEITRLLAGDSSDRAPRPAASFADVDALLLHDDLKAARDRVEEMARNLSGDDPLRIGCYRREGTIDYREGGILKSRSSFLSGIALARKLKVRGPELADCFLGLSDCLKAQGDVKHAIKILQKALDAGPNSTSMKKINFRLQRLQAAAPAEATPAAPVSAAPVAAKTLDP